MRKLKVFEGKVCTIMTASTGLHIADPKRHAEFFTGLVKEIDDSGIWLEHLQTKAMSYFLFPIVGIVEEQFIAKDDPRAKEIEELKKKSEIKPKPVLPKVQPRTASSFIPIDELTAKVRANKLT